MKRIRCLLLLSSVLLFGAIGHAQNPFWTFPKKYLDGWGLTSTLPGSSTPSSKYSHAGLMDPFGEIMFFKIDEKLFNHLGVQNSTFSYYYGAQDIIPGVSESLIVPQPGTCDKFYVFQSGRAGYFSDELPFYSVYLHVGGSFGGALDYVDNYGTAVPIEGNLIEDWYLGYSSPQYKGIHFAATKERDDDKRRVFISNNAEVYRLELGCDGLDSTGWKYTFNPGGLNSALRFGWRSEMELYEDETTGNVRLAIPYLHNTASGDIKIAIFDLDGSVFFGQSPRNGMIAACLRHRKPLARRSSLLQ